MPRLDTALSRCATRARVAHVEAHQRKGFNLVEAAIVLGIIGLVIGGIWTAASAVTENNKLRTAISGTQIIVQNTIQLFKESWPPVLTSYGPFTRLGGSSGQTPPLAKTLGILNGTEFTVSGDKIEDPWNRPGSVGVDIDINHPNFLGIRTVSVSFSNLKTESCIRLVAGITSAFKNNAMYLGVELPNNPGVLEPSTPFIPTAVQCTGDIHPDPTIGFTAWLLFVFSP